MTAPDHSEILHQLAEDYTARVRAGELPELEEYARHHPDLAERIRALFPTLLFLEGMAGAGLHEGATVAPGPHLAELTPGQTFNHYRIEREIGRGGMGVVYEAVHVPLGKRVALKVLSLGAAPGSAALERFLREAQTAAGLHHTNIVPVFDIGQASGLPYYAMQCIDGHGLDRLLQEEKSATGEDYFRWVAGLGAQAAEGLAYAHERGIIHRDIKPSNLILDGQGVLWITDFGLARRAADPALTHSGAIVGTPRYMSPEQAEAARKPVDHRTDVYSLGATLYELVTRRAPFTGDTPVDILLQILERDPVSPRRLDPTVPRDLETIIMKAMAKRPEDRYQKAAELTDDLRRWLEGEPIRARRISLAGRAVRWWRRNPKLATTIYVFWVIFFALNTFYYTLLRRENGRMLRSANEASAERQRAHILHLIAKGERDRAQNHLCRALHEQARTVLASSEPGRRWKVLELVDKAEKLRSRESQVSDSELPKQADLRSLAVSSLLLRDARIHKTWPGTPLAMTRDARYAIMLGPSTRPVKGIERAQMLLLDLGSGSSHVLAEGDLPSLVFRSPTFSHDGRQLATTARNGEVILREIPNGQPERRLVPPVDSRTKPDGDSTYGELAFHPRGTHLAGLRRIMSKNRLQIVHWDLQATGPARVLVDEPEPENIPFLNLTLAFTPSGKWLVYSGANGITLCDPQSGKKAELRVPGENPQPLLSFAMAYRSEMLIATYQASKKRVSLVVWDLSRRVPTVQTELDAAQVQSLEVSPDEKWLALLDDAGATRILRLSDGTEVLRRPFQEDRAAWGFWHPDSRRLFLATLGQLELWEPPWETAVSTLPTPTDYPKSLAFSPDGQWVALGIGKEGSNDEDADSSLCLVHRATGKRRHLAVKEPMLQVRFSPDGKSLGGISRSSAQLWLVENTQEKIRFNAPAEHLITSGGFNASGDFLVAVWSKNEATSRGQVWNTSTRKQVFEAPLQTNEGSLSQDGRFLVTHPYWELLEGFGNIRSESVVVWDLASGKQLHPTLKGGQEILGGDAEWPTPSPDGRWLMTTATRLSLVSLSSVQGYVWDLNSGQVKLRVHGPEAISCYAYSPDSKLLAVGYRDGTAQVWDLERGEKLFQWQPHREYVLLMEFTPDGKFLATCDGRAPDLQMLDLTMLRRQLAEVALGW